MTPSNPGEQRRDPLKCNDAGIESAQARVPGPLGHAIDRCGRVLGGAWKPPSRFALSGTSETDHPQCPISPPFFCFFCVFFFLAGSQGDPHPRPAPRPRHHIPGLVGSVSVNPSEATSPLRRRVSNAPENMRTRSRNLPTPRPGPPPANRRFFSDRPRSRKSRPQPWGRVVRHLRRPARLTFSSGVRFCRRQDGPCWCFVRGPRNRTSTPGCRLNWR